MIGYTKLIEMNKELIHYSPPIASKTDSLLLKHEEWVRKELEDWEKAGIIQKSLSPYASPIVVVLRKCPTV